MSNLLEYTLSLRDRMSAAMRQIGVNSDGALNRFANLQRQAREVELAMAQFGRTTGTLRQRLELLRAEREWIPTSNIRAIRRYNQEIQDLERQIAQLERTGQRMPGMFAQAFQAIPFAGFFTNPLIVAGAAAGQALRLGIQQDLQNTSFEVLLNSEEAAKKMVADITKYGMETPYDKMGLGENAKTMLSFGIASQKIMPTLKAIGDIAMGDANKMSSLTLAYSQMSSTGKLMGQDLLQMINAGFNPLNEISKTTGKSIGQLKEEMEKGKISTKMVEDAFMGATKEGGQFHNMAVKMGQTMGGKWAQFMDNVSEKFLILYGVISPATMALIDLGGAALDAVFNGIGWLVDKFQEGNPVIWGITIALGVVTSALMIMKAATMAQAAWTTISTLAINMSTKAWWLNNAAMLANPVTWIVAGVIALIALIGLLIYKVDGWGEAWKHTVNAIKFLFGGLMGSLKLGWLESENFLLSGIDKIRIAWYKLKGLWDSEGAQLAIDEITRRSEERQQAVTQTRNQAKSDYAAAWQETKKAAGSLKWNDKGIGDFTREMKSKLGIATPAGVPGANMVNSNLAGGNGNKDKDKSNEAMATGGTKHNYITINLDSLIRALTIQGNDFKDTADQMTTQTQDALLRLLAMATTANS
ncbi:tape measure protein [Sphingobacterium siyangense]|uniref:Tape measure domain-containing protein n=1 Tax=Sphingobacterium siyangense TaxID=459529 RepID=A0A562MQS2_9SPHI|nr:tape measure protein [Sphingobacterium siyangense]TWI22200.1 tape measure domain-containing protein [Sphingobacterium siyangense]